MDATRLALGVSAPLWSWLVPIVIAAGPAGYLAVTFRRDPTGTLPVTLTVSSAAITFTSRRRRERRFEWASLKELCTLVRPALPRVWDPVKGDWVAAHLQPVASQPGSGSKTEPAPRFFQAGDFRADLTEEAYSAILDSAEAAGMSIANPTDLQSETWHYLRIERPRNGRKSLTGQTS